MPTSTPRVIVITGVTRGLGRALATSFARGGHRVFGCGRSTQALHALAHELGSPHEFHEVDVREDQVVAAWVKHVVTHAHAPDLLVNNAALINHDAPLWEVPAQEFNQLVDVNIKGVYNVLRHFLPPMLERGSGVIVNFSSYWGRSTSPRVAPYCATKWAIEGLTRALAQEMPKGLAAVPVNPGIIDTEMLRTCFGEEAGEYLGPDQWAKAAVPFLLGLSAKDNGKPLTVPGQ
jgi:NAD(P)-dependent dehydrogenase (short-subunit alcohol dehydrogenase family)